MNIAAGVHVEAGGTTVIVRHRICGDALIYIQVVAIGRRSDSGNPLIEVQI